MTGAEFWVHLALLGVIGAFILLLVAAVCKMVEWLMTARDALRERYDHHRGEVTAMDVVLIPVWLIVEITALVVGLVLVIFLAWAAYDAARSFRDWWHAGDSRR